MHTNGNIGPEGTLAEVVQYYGEDFTSVELMASSSSWSNGSLRFKNQFSLRMILNGKSRKKLQVVHGLPRLSSMHGGYVRILKITSL